MMQSHNPEKTDFFRQERTNWGNATAVAKWKTPVGMDFPVRYCPRCKMEHPVFACYCILCGKPLLKPEYFPVFLPRGRFRPDTRVYIELRP